jgi:putative peptidoglycan lipid II flippase
MVSRLLKLFTRDVVSMNQAALVLAVFSVLSQLLGLIRDRLLAAQVGPSAALDVYYAAFRVPDFIYNSFGILFSVTVLIPFITDCLKEDESGRTSLKAFMNSVFSVYVFGMVIVSGIAIALMPWLTKLTAPGFNLAQHADLVLYSRIMMLSPFLFGLSSLLSSFAQVQKKFLAFAIAPLLYNVGILIGVILLRPIWGITGVVIGVLIGATFHFLIQLPTLLNLHRFPTLSLKIDWPLIRRVFALSLPRTLAASLTNITFIIMSAIASLLAIGSVSIFQFSYNIENIPLLIFGISYAVAAFPTMSKLYADGARQEFIDVLYRTTRTIFFFTMPFALLMIVLRAHVVRVLLGSGEFSWNDTRLVAASVALFCISVTAQSMTLLLCRAFFAARDTWTPLRINMIGVCITALSALGLIYSYHHAPMFTAFVDSLLRIEGTIGGSVVLLSLAFSLGQIVNAWLLWRKFHTKIDATSREAATLSRTLSHMTAAAIIAAAAAYATLSLIGSSVDQTKFLGVLIQAVVAGVVGLAFYGITLAALRNEDILLFIGTVKSKFWKQKPLVPQQQDL